MHESSTHRLAIAKTQLLSALRLAGIEESECRREADLIIEHATGLRLSEQILKADQILSQEALETIEFIITQRRQRMPLQYCLGHTYFMGLKFVVRPGVLIPRTDTEALVETALRRLEKIACPAIAEIGTGSGAIAVSLLVRRTDAQVTGIDISANAVALTYENALLHRVLDRLTFIESDWKDALPLNLDAIVSNPPYIPVSQGQDLLPEVGRYEPPEALFGQGEDGLEFYRDFSQTGAAHLKPGGLAVLEVGDGAAESVADILRLCGWQSVEVNLDLNQLPRVVSALAPVQRS